MKSTAIIIRAQLRIVWLIMAVAIPAMAQRVKAVDSIGFTVSDIDRSVEFFTRVLNFEKESEREFVGDDFEHLLGVFGLRVRVVRMRLGDEHIELTEYLTPRGRPIPADSRGNDQWFQHIAIVTSDMEKAYQWLRKNKVEHASTGPQRLPEWNPNAGGIKAFYFKDLDGHTLEILQFPAGKGDPKWQRLANRDEGRLFLGIDHTAIVVSNTEQSLNFYRDLLGLRVAGESENYGIEQERLNNVFGAHLKITSLRAMLPGPGIEFLEYLSPIGGRKTPADARANDLFHWQTKLTVEGVSELWLMMIKERLPLISSGPIDLAGANTGFKRSFMARDPDYHAIQFLENR